jgi:hypothetical protein
MVPDMFKSFVILGAIFLGILVIFIETGMLYYSGVNL